MADTKHKVKLTKEVEAMREVLTAKRDELAKRIEERRQEILVDHEPEDEAGIAVRSSTAGLAITIIERDVRTLSEIDLCLRLMDKGEYGVCTACEEKIPAARLRAIPWTRRCVECAGGSVRTSHSRLDPGFNFA